MNTYSLQYQNFQGLRYVIPALLRIVSKTTSHRLHTLISVATTGNSRWIIANHVS